MSVMKPIPQAAIRIEELTKTYGTFRAVDSISLEVKPGEIYGFLGRNGAGKTTSIRMMLGLIRADQGTVSLNGVSLEKHPGEALGSVGFLVESATAYPGLTVTENLEVARLLRGVHRDHVSNAIETLGLTAYRHIAAGKLSLGNLQRLALARAILHRPRILILDEPSNALDPAGVVEIREYLRSVAVQQGTSILLSSHALGEISLICDRIGIIHNGQLVSEFTSSSWDAEGQTKFRVRCADQKLATNILQSEGFRTDEAGADIIVHGCKQPARIPAALVAAGIDLYALIPENNNLETHFLAMTGGNS